MKKQPTDEISIGPEVSPGVHRALRRCGDDVTEVFVTPGHGSDGEPIPPGVELAQLGASSCDCGDGHWRSLRSIYKDERSGPAQVATPEYREGYDRIFGKKQKVGLA